MPYAGSYIWKIRQKIGHDLLIMPGVDVVPVREDGKILMVYNKDYDDWIFPGGYVESDATWQENAARELKEEAAFIANPDDLIPILAASSSTARYKNGDVVKIFSMSFLARRYTETNSELDEIEIREKRWFDLDEIEEITRSNDYQSRVLIGLKKYLATGEFQMITIDDKEENGK